jgi:hypothetical protein
MLIIRNEQMNILSRHMLHNFEEEMLAYLKTLKDLPEREMRGMVETAIKEALVFGITLEDDVRRYLECHAEYGSDFSIEEGFDSYSYEQDCAAAYGAKNNGNARL